MRGEGCEKMPRDGMRSDGETSDPTEEERMSAQVRDGGWEVRGRR